MDFKQSFYELFNTECEGDTLDEMIENYTQSHRDYKISAFYTLLRQYGAEQAGKIRGKSITSAASIYDHYQALFLGKLQEEFHIVILDNKSRIIDTRLITIGTINQNLVHPREIFAPAIQRRATGIILIHNHPSGDPIPSQQDIRITQRLKEAGEILGIKVLDHVVIGSGGFYSFVDENRI